MLTWQLHCMPVTPDVPMSRPRGGWEPFAVGLIEGQEHVWMRRPAAQVSMPEPSSSAETESNPADALASAEVTKLAEATAQASVPGSAERKAAESGADDRRGFGYYD